MSAMRQAKPTHDSIDIREELLRLQHAWMDALARRDEPTLERLLADEFTLTSARSDRLIGKNEWLEYAMTRVSLRSFRYDDLRVQLYGDAAVVKSRFTQTAAVDGVERADTLLLTDVWVWRDGRWQVVTRHSSIPSATPS